jgi:hypothetical protein
MTFGPLVAAAGFLLMLRMSAHTAYVTEMLPGMLVFGLGLACTVSPLTAAILGGVDQRHAGIASAINNAVARVAGLLAVAAVGAIIAARFSAASPTRPTTGWAAPPARSSRKRGRGPSTRQCPATSPTRDAVQMTLDDARSPRCTRRSGRWRGRWCWAD